MLKKELKGLLLVLDEISLYTSCYRGHI